MTLKSRSLQNFFSDYFFESMILLKHEFGWEWEDVLYFVTNQRSNPKQLRRGFQNDASRPLIGWYPQGRSRRPLISGPPINIDLKTLLSDDLKSRISEWNSLDAKIFQKSNETFWEKYKSMPNLSTLENEFGIEIGTLKLASKYPVSQF